jgi:enoyl-CoA hydratase
MTDSDPGPGGNHGRGQDAGPEGDVLVERAADGVATITLNAPRRRNSITLDLARDLVAACRALNDDPSVGATVIRAAGPVFCSGADRALLARVGSDPSSEDNVRDLMTIYSSFSSVANLAMPTIAAVQGAALGAGLNLVLSADLCLVTEETRLLSGFLPIGVHPGGGHFTLLAKRTNPQIAAAMALFGQELVGDAAVEAGLAFEACTAARLYPRAVELAAVAGADPALSRKALDSFRAQTGLPQAQATGTRIELAAQMWSMARSRRPVDQAVDQAGPAVAPGGRAVAPGEGRTRS